MSASKLEQFADMLIANEKCKSEDKEIIVYGLSTAIEMAFNFISTLILGLVFGMLIESIIFLVSFSFLRTYAGGYHARTALRCYFFSITTIIITLIVLQSEVVHHGYYLIMLVLAIPIIMALSPVPDANKPLDAIEVKVYKKRAYMILAINVFIGIIAYIFKLYSISNTVCLAMFVLAIILLLGKYINTKNNTEVVVDEA